MNRSLKMRWIPSDDSAHALRMRWTRAESSTLSLCSACLAPVSCSLPWACRAPVLYRYSDISTHTYRLLPTHWPGFMKIEWMTRFLYAKESMREEASGFALGPVTGAT